MAVKIKNGFDQISNENAVTKGGQYKAGTVNNAHLTSVDIIAKGVIVGDKTDDLETSLQAPISSSRSSNIVVSRMDWETAVRKLTNAQQTVLDNAVVSDEEKIAWILSANREVAGHGGNIKYTFAVQQGPNSGEVEVTAEVADAVAHLVTWTEDLVDFTKKADPWTSTSAKTTVPHVPTGVRLAFFHKGIYATKRMDWEGPIYLTVN